MTHTVQTDIELVKLVVRGHSPTEPEARIRLAVLVASGLILPGGINRVPADHINTLNAYTIGPLSPPDLSARMKRQDPEREAHTRLVSRIIRLITAAGGKITHSKLANATKAKRLALTDALTAAGVIIEVSQPTRGRPRITYHLPMPENAPSAPAEASTPI